MTDKENLRIKLRATVEANKIARMGTDTIDERIREIKREMKCCKNKDHKKKLKYMIEVLETKIEEREKSINNSYAEYADNIAFGGCGISGNDSG